LFFIMSIMLIVFVILRPPIEYYRQYFAQWTANKILYDIRDRLFTHIQKLSFKYYANTRSGEIISRVINDVEQTKTFVITGLMNLWLDIATIVIAIVIMFSMNKHLFRLFCFRSMLFRSSIFSGTSACSLESVLRH
jgi:ATP-binding cassette, subfamily B, putative efflux pump